MDWLLKHKLLVVLGIAAGIYWFNNPAGRFGIVREGLVVYNRIPVTFFDCYIDPDGKLTLVSDLSEPVNVNYWFENHLKSNRGNTPVPLIIGTGFETEQFKPGATILKRCRQYRFEPKILSSRGAITLFNELHLQEKKCALLLKTH